MDRPRPGGGESSEPRYARVPIGGPDRPPVTQTPSPGTIYASTPGRPSSYHDRGERGSLDSELQSPAVKREPGLLQDSEYPPEPQSAVTDYTDHSSTTFLDARANSLKSEDAENEPQRKRQKRNKPTLSCFECVERKTKVGLLLSSKPWFSSSTACCSRGAPTRECFSHTEYELPTYLSSSALVFACYRMAL